MYNDLPRLSLDSTSGNHLPMNDERLNYQMTTATDALYMTPAIPADMSSSKGDDGKSPLQFIDYEKSEPIVRFLAQVRKLGMDILFPQSTHDKVLACIYVSIKTLGTPAHRDVIDMVMAVRESGDVSNLENISKTKIRGILALLKHGEILSTQSSETEPVRLYFNQPLASFQEFREKHDAFLANFMNQNNLFVPSILRGEIIWLVDDQIRMKRIAAIDDLMNNLQEFYQGYLTVVNNTQSTAPSHSLESMEASATGLSSSSSESITFTNSVSPTARSTPTIHEKRDWFALGKKAAHEIQHQAANAAATPVSMSSSAGLSSSSSGSSPHMGHASGSGKQQHFLHSTSSSISLSHSPQLPTTGGRGYIPEIQLQVPPQSPSFHHSHPYLVHPPHPRASSPRAQSPLHHATTMLNYPTTRGGYMNTTAAATATRASLLAAGMNPMIPPIVTNTTPYVGSGSSSNSSTSSGYSPTANPALYPVRHLTTSGGMLGGSPTAYGTNLPVGPYGTTVASTSSPTAAAINNTNNRILTPTSQQQLQQQQLRPHYTSHYRPNQPIKYAETYSGGLTTTTGTTTASTTTTTSPTANMITGGSSMNKGMPSGSSMMYHTKYQPPPQAAQGSHLQQQHSPLAAQQLPPQQLPQQLPQQHQQYSLAYQQQYAAVEAYRQQFAATNNNTTTTSPTALGALPVPVPPMTIMMPSPTAYPSPTASVYPHTSPTTATTTTSSTPSAYYHHPSLLPSAPSLQQQQPLYPSSSPHSTTYPSSSYHHHHQQHLHPTTTNTTSTQPISQYPSHHQQLQQQQPHTSVTATTFEEQQQQHHQQQQQLLYQQAAQVQYLQQQQHQQQQQQQAEYFAYQQAQQQAQQLHFMHPSSQQPSHHPSYTTTAAHPQSTTPQSSYYYTSIPPSNTMNNSSHLLHTPTAASSSNVYRTDELRQSLPTMPESVYGHHPYQQSRNAAESSGRDERQSDTSSSAPPGQQQVATGHDTRHTLQNYSYETATSREDGVHVPWKEFDHTISSALSLEMSREEQGHPNEKGINLDQSS